MKRCWKYCALPRNPDIKRRSQAKAALEKKFAITLESNDVIINTLIGMLGESPEVYEVENDKNQFFIAPRTPAIAAPDQEEQAMDKSAPLNLTATPGPLPQPNTVILLFAGSG